MSVVSKAKEQEVEPLQLELPPVKIMFLPMSKTLPTGEGDMLPVEIEQIIGRWISSGYKIVEGSVSWSEEPNYWQLALMLVKYD